MNQHHEFLKHFIPKTIEYLSTDKKQLRLKKLYKLKCLKEKKSFSE